MRTDVRDALLRGISGAADTHDAFQLRARHQDGTSPIDVFTTIDDLQIPLSFGALDGLLGACVRVDSATVGILITTQRSLHIQRFTAAHELGHFILEHEGSLDREVRSPGNTEGRPLPEVEADAFAAEFLMPKWLIRATAERRGWWSAERLQESEVVYQLSLRLGLSYDATCWGLLAADYIPKKTAIVLADEEPKEMKRRALGGVLLKDSWADVWVLQSGDAGARLDAGPNDIFIVQLEEQAASGFRWDTRTATDAGFRLLDDSSRLNDRRVGGPSTRQLIFAAPTAGLHELELSHQRSFSKSSAASSIRFSISTYGSVKDSYPLAAGVTVH